MDTMDITLIVKASNQQFEDQTIKCEPSWTIRRLKGHLTEVYPGKPSTDEQKLIYSGQLLGDSVVLKDILRHYDGQEAHTVHLVFTPKNNRHTRDFGSSSSRGTSSSGSDQQRSSKSMSPKPSTSSSGDGAVATASTSAGSSSRSACEDPAASGSGTSFGADGLRQRNVVTNATQSSGDTATNPNPVAAPVSAEYIMSQHLAMQNWMQQVYAQYLNQCMSVISGQSNPQAPFASAPANNPATAVTPPQLNPMAAMASTLPPPPPLAASIVNSNPLFAQTLPNLAYYPYLSSMNSFPMPSASSIPAPISSSGTIPVSTPAPTSQPPTTIPVAATPAPPEAVAGPSRAVPSVGGIQQPIASSSSTASTVNAASAQGTAQPAANPDQTADAAAVPGAAAEAAPAAARRFPNIVVEEQENRDWLDIFFSMCRVGILMTVVYLYSSPVRCISVLFIGVMLYLYQIGFFRNNNAERIERARQIVVQQINNAHGVRQNLNAAAAANPAADDQPDNGGETDSADSSKGTSSGEASESGSADAAKDATGSQTEEVAPAEAAPLDDQQSASNVVPEANRVNVNDVAAFLRTLVLSFFTSIIPDTPAA